MPNQRTTILVVAVIVLLCLCVVLLSIGAGGYFFLNQKAPVAQSPAAIPTPNVVLAAPTPRIIPSPPVIPTVSANAACDDVEEFDDQGYDHIRPGQPHPPYNSDPPTSGWHWANPQEWGVYSAPQVQEQIVHNLEHGGIVIQYNNLPAVDLNRLLAYVANDPRHILVAPYPGLPGNRKIVWEAWTVSQFCAGLDLAALGDFIEEFRDQGPESVP
jgi:hypothetical protein